MRVVQFLQVMVLLVVLGYGLLLSLDNPVTLHLPIPFAERELLLPAGAALLLSVLLGVGYGAFLLLPPLWTLRRSRQQDRQRRRQAESNLQAALRARLGLGEARAALLTPSPVQAPTQGSAAPASEAQP